MPHTIFCPDLQYTGYKHECGELGPMYTIGYLYDLPSITKQEADTIHRRTTAVFLCSGPAMFHCVGLKEIIKVKQTLLGHVIIIEYLVLLLINLI